MPSWGAPGSQGSCTAVMIPSSWAFDGGRLWVSVPSTVKVNSACLPRGFVGLGPLKELGALELLEVTVMVAFPDLSCAQQHRSPNFPTHTDGTEGPERLSRSSYASLQRTWPRRAQASSFERREGKPLAQDYAVFDCTAQGPLSTSPSTKCLSGRERDVHAEPP